MTLDCLDRGRGDAAFNGIHAKVDKRRSGRGCLPGTARERKFLVSPVTHVVECLERGSRRAKHHRHTGLLSADDRKIARGVPKAALVLLVRSIVLFIYNDDAEIAH